MYVKMNAYNDTGCKMKRSMNFDMDLTLFPFNLQSLLPS